MALIVQKYGGSSVGTIDRIRNVARRLIEVKKEGNKIMAVISAMSGVTDKLIGLAHEVMDNPPERELDMLLATGEQQSIALLCMAITDMGYKAMSFTGQQAGVCTYGSHTRGRIHSIDPKRVIQALEDDYIVFDDEYINAYRNTGGFDIIGSGRTKLETQEQFAVVVENCKNHGVNALVIIGGDDSNTNAAVLAEYFAANKSAKVIFLRVPSVVASPVVSNTGVLVAFDVGAIAWIAFSCIFSRNASLCRS